MPVLVTVGKPLVGKQTFGMRDLQRPDGRTLNLSVGLVDEVSDRVSGRTLGTHHGLLQPGLEQAKAE